MRNSTWERTGSTDSWARSSRMNALSDLRSQSQLIPILESSTHKSVRHDAAARSFIRLDANVVQRRADRCDKRESCDMR